MFYIAKTHFTKELILEIDTISQDMKTKLMSMAKELKLHVLQENILIK